MKRTIDLNADLGEGPGEAALYPLITSANVACGGHAGDEASMREAVRLAILHGVAIGAHPSYPDRESVGRVSMTFAPAELELVVARQVGALAAIVAEAGGRLTHVKPHGALYNDVARDTGIAAAVAGGVARISRELILVGLADSPALPVWRSLGFRVAAEGFADRAYEADGMLVSRSRRGAVLADPRDASVQALRLARSRRCDTICVHSDTPGAVAILAAVRFEIVAAGFGLESMSTASHTR